MEINKLKTIGIVSDEDKLKLAAILFDEILPVKTEQKIPDSLLCKVPINYDVINSVIENDKKKYSKSDLKILTNEIFPSYFSKRKEIPESEVKDILRTVFQEGYNKAVNLQLLECSRQINRGKSIGVPIFNESILLNRLIEDYKENKTIDKVEIELVNAPIISVDSLDWKQISQAKEDPFFIQKVKRFSLFINSNYSGKDISFITDDLSIQVDDYQNACKKHGIKMLNGTLKTLSNSKSLFGTLGMVLCSIICKSPDVALMSGLIGGTLELANLSITIKERKDNFHSFINDSPISLIYEIEKLKKST